MEFSADIISGETIAGEALSSTSYSQKEFILVNKVIADS